MDAAEYSKNGKRNIYDGDTCYNIWDNRTHRNNKIKRGDGMRKILVFFVVSIVLSGCISQKEETKKKELDLEIGEETTYEFYSNGNYIGYDRYKVTGKEGENYLIESEVNLEKLGLKMDAKYTITKECIPIHYEFVAYVNNEKQTVSCDFKKGSVHEVATKGDQKFEKDIKLEEGTYLLDNNMIGQWTLMLRMMELKTGDSHVIPMFAAQPMKALKIEMNVGEIEKVDGYDCYKLDFPELEYFMYISEGKLIKMETEDKTLVITLKS